MIEKTVFSAKVTGKRQITIPIEICNMMEIEGGDRVIFNVRDNEVLFEKDKTITLLKEQPSIENNEIKCNLYIPYTLLSDALTMGYFHVTDAVFDKALEIVKNGGKVIVQKEYINAAPEIMKIFDTLEEIEAWKKRFYETK